MQYLKADTAVEVLVGPAVAVGDGFTPVTSLTIAGADEAELIKYNGATALTATAITGTLAAITNADGYYTLDLAAGDVDTEGFLTLVINDDSLILPIRHEFMVVNANVYDALFAAATTDYLQVDAIQWNGTAVATPTVAGVPEVDITHIVGGLVPTPATTGIPDVNVREWLDTAVTAATAGRPDVNITAINDVTNAAAVVQAWFGAGINGTADAGGTTTTLVDAALTEIDDIHNYKALLLRSGTDAGSVRLVTNFVAATDTLTFAPAVSTSVGAGVTYTLLPLLGNVDVQSWLGVLTAAATVNALVAGRVDASVGAVAANAIDAAAIADGAIDAATFAAGAIDAAAIANGAIDAATFAAGAIDAAAIANGAIDAATFAAGAIDAAAIANGAIDAATFAAGAIDAAAIAADAIDASALATDAVNEIARAINPQTNTAFANITFEMYDSTNHNPMTGLTVSGQRSLDGAAYGAVTGTIAEIASGTYQIDASAADMNAAMIVFRFSAAGADDTFVHVKTAA